MGLVLVGEAGIGKTTLWNAALASAARRGFHVLASRTASSDVAAPARRIRRPVLRRLPGAPLEPRRSAAAGARGRAPARRAGRPRRRPARALRRHREPAPLARSGDPAPDRARRRAVARREHGGHPRVRRAPPARLPGRRAALGARGGTEPDPLGLATALRPSALERLELGPLSLAALHRRVRRAARPLVPAPDPAHDRERIGRQPVLRARDSAGARARATRRSSPGEPLPVPDTLAALTAERVGGAARADAEALAPRRGGDRADAADACRRRSLGPDAALRPRSRGGSSAIDGAKVRFSHPLLAQAALASADEEALRSITDRLAETARSEDARARHLGSGGDRAGRGRRRRARASGGARAARAARRSTRSRSTSARASDAGARARSRAGARRGGRRVQSTSPTSHYADAILERGRSSARAQARRARRRRACARSSGTTTAARQTRRVSARRLSRRQSASPAARAKVLLRIAYLHAQLDMERSQAEIARGVDSPRARTRSASIPTLLASALLDRANCALQMADRLRLRGHRARDAPARGRAGARGSGSARSVVYELARHTDDLEAALAKLIRADRAASRSRRRGPVLASCTCRSCTLARRLDERARLGGARARRLRARGRRALARVRAAGPRARRRAPGSAPRTRALAPARACDSPASAATSSSRSSIGRSSASSRSRPETCTQPTSTSRRQASSTRSVGARHPLRSRLDGDRAETALALGDLVARRGASSIGSSAPGARRRPRGRSPSARAAAACSKQRAAISTRRLRRSSAPSPSTSACRCRSSARARCSRRARCTTGARRSGSPTSRSVRRCGSSTSSVPRSGPSGRDPSSRGSASRRRESSELNETERRVAELAAEGLSNQEIAQRAFLSVKTVEANLTRVYRKLGIRSRAALARRLP